MVSRYDDRTIFRNIEEIYEKALVITSSPGPIFKLINEIKSASVPLEVVMQ